MSTKPTYCEAHGVNLVQNERCMLCVRGIECWVDGSTFKWSTDGGGEREATSGEVLFWSEIQRLTLENAELWATVNGNPPPSDS